MSTPTWIAFDVGESTRQQSLIVADRVMQSHRFDLFRVGDLVMADGSLGLGKIEIPASAVSSALSTARQWAGVMLSYRAARMGGNFHAYSWQHPSGDGFGLEIPQSAPAYGVPEGFWLQEFLCELSMALGARLCLYSADQELLVIPTVGEALDRLRSGNIFRFLLVATELLDRAQFEELQRLGAASGMVYFPIGPEFHAWSRLVAVRA